MLVINFVYSDISPEVRQKIESLCAEGEKTFIVDFGFYEPFLVKGKWAERKVWRADFEKCVPEAQKITARLAEELKDAFLNAEKTFKAPFSCEGISLWEVLKFDFLRVFFIWCRVTLFAAKLIDTASSGRIIYIWDKRLAAFDSKQFFDTFKTLARTRSLEFLDVPLHEEVCQKSLIQRGLIKIRLRKEALCDKIEKTKNFLRILFEPAASEKIIAFGYRYPSPFQLVAPALDRIKQKYPVQLWFSEVSCHNININNLKKVARKHHIPWAVFKKKKNAAVDFEAMLGGRSVEKWTEMVVLSGAFQRACGTAVDSKFLEAIFLCFFSPEAVKRNIFLIKDMKQLLEKNNVKAVLLSVEESTEEKICCYLAARKGVKVFLAPHYYDQFLIKEVSLRQRPFLANRYFVMGKKTEEDLIELGIDPEIIEVTGIPKFDIPRQGYSPMATGDFFKKWKIRGSFSGIFAWTLQGLDYEAALFEHLKEMMRSFPEKILIIRPHPNAGKTFNVQKTKNIIFHSKSTLCDLLSAADVLITVTSITALEAIFRDKPVLIANLWNLRYPFPFLEAKAAVEVTRPADVVPMIKRILGDSKLQDLLKEGRRKIRDEYHPGAGVESGERIAEALRR